MSVYTFAISQAISALDKAENAAQLAVDRYNQIRSFRGQEGYSITIGGISVSVAVTDSRTYQGKLIRGREMIHLGALKALEHEKDQAFEYVKECREHLLKVVNR